MVAEMIKMRAFVEPNYNNIFPDENFIPRLISTWEGSWG